MGGVVPVVLRGQALCANAVLPDTNLADDVVCVLDALLPAPRALFGNGQGLVLAELFAPLDDGGAHGAEKAHGQGEDVGGELGGLVVVEGVGVGVDGGAVL